MASHGNESTFLATALTIAPVASKLFQDTHEPFFSAILSKMRAGKVSEPQVARGASVLVGLCAVSSERPTEVLNATLSSYLSTILQLILKQDLSKACMNNLCDALYKVKTVLASVPAESHDELVAALTLEKVLLAPSGTGRRLTAYAFATMGSSFVSKVHETIVATYWMPTGVSAATHKAVAEVYFRGWRLARGAADAESKEMERLEIEHRLEHGEESGVPELANPASDPASATATLNVMEKHLQEAVECAVHCAEEQAVGASKLILDFFAANRRAAGVDGLLEAMYAPILWRALAAANPTVRLQAATVLSRAFPVVDTDASPAERASALQQNFDAMHELLKDEAPLVRMAGIRLVGRALVNFSELLPASTVKSLGTRLINTMCFDQSSAPVRVTSLIAIKSALTNPAIRAPLQPLLKNLAPLLMDDSERVRGGFASLLVSLSSLAGLSAFDVVDASDILASLPQQSQQLREPLVQLLLDTYWPKEVTGAELMDRLLAAFGHSKCGTIAFYTTATSKQLVSRARAGRLINYICARIKSAHDAAEVEDDREADEEVDEPTAAGGRKRGRGAGAADSEAKRARVSANIFSTANADDLTVVLEIVQGVWGALDANIMADKEKLMKRAAARGRRRGKAPVVTAEQVASDEQLLELLHSALSPAFMAQLGYALPVTSLARGRLVQLGAVRSAEQMRRLVDEAWKWLDACANAEVVANEGATVPTLRLLLDGLVQWGGAEQAVAKIADGMPSLRCVLLLRTALNSAPLRSALLKSEEEAVKLFDALQATSKLVENMAPERQGKAPSATHRAIVDAACALALHAAGSSVTSAPLQELLDAAVTHNMCSSDHPFSVALVRLAAEAASMDVFEEDDLRGRQSTLTLLRAAAARPMLAPVAVKAAFHLLSQGSSDDAGSLLVTVLTNCTAPEARDKLQKLLHECMSVRPSEEEDQLTASLIRAWIATDQEVTADLANALVTRATQTRDSLADKAIDAVARELNAALTEQAQVTKAMDVAEAMINGNSTALRRAVRATLERFAANDAGTTEARHRALQLVGCA
jgi:hypothetical protein